MLDTAAWARTGTTGPTVGETLTRAGLKADNKQRKLTDQQHFLTALGGVAKGNINLALKEAGYADSSKSNVIDSLKDEIVDVATKILAKSAPIASQKVSGDIRK